MDQILSYFGKAGLSLGDPHWLIYLAAVPLVMALTMALAMRRRRKLKEGYGDQELIERFATGISTFRLGLKALAAGLAAAALIMALCRPTASSGENHYPVGSIDVVSVIDVSRSMAVPDYENNHLPSPYSEGRRLDMAKYLLSSEVMGALNFNRLGIVTFAGEPYPQAFISDDLPALRWFMKSAIRPGSAPGEGSQMAAAFRMAFTLFDLDSKPGHRRVIVLFSDGGNDSSADEMRDMITELKKRGIGVVIVGLGKSTASAIPLRLLSPDDQAGAKPGAQWYEFNGEIVTSKLEENDLLSIKNATGGRYVRIDRASDFSMERMISKMEMKAVPGKNELFPWFLMAGLVFFVLSMIIAQEPKEGDPASAKTRERKGGDGKGERR